MMESVRECLERTDQRSNMNKSRTNKKSPGDAKRMTTKRIAASAAMGVGLVAGGAGIASAASTTTTLPPAQGATQSPPRAMDPGDFAVGVITALSATSITVQNLSGTTTTYATDSDTTFSEGPTTIASSELAVGEHVMIHVSSADATTAASVNLHLARLSGRVTALSGNSVTITDVQGFNQTIEVGPSTTYTTSGAASESSALVVGSLISAEGEVAANLITLDASSVAIGPFAGPQNDPSGPGVPGFASLGAMHQ
jgi:hypothetical protein